MSAVPLAAYPPRFDADEDDVQAVFAYGTLRGDYDEKGGDRWGVITSTNAVWRKAVVRGFRLYQDRKKPFPFAVRTGRESDVLCGTLLTWRDPVAARVGVAAAERMEGYAVGYLRTKVTAYILDDAGGVEAEPEDVGYIYYVKLPSEDVSRCFSFPYGDWLRPIVEPRGNAPDLVEAMFSYGRFRGDYGKEHIQLGGNWIPAIAAGFKLYEDEKLPYPFAVYTGSDQDVLHGTLTTWAGFEEALRGRELCDEAEQIIQEMPMEGTYRRTATEISWVVAGGDIRKTMAFIYYQEWPQEYLSECKLYSQGDWLVEHVSM